MSTPKVATSARRRRSPCSSANAENSIDAAVDRLPVEPTPIQGTIIHNSFHPGLHPCGPMDSLGHRFPLPWPTFGDQGGDRRSIVNPPECPIWSAFVRQASALAVARWCRWLALRAAVHPAGMPRAAGDVTGCRCAGHDRPRRGSSDDAVAVDLAVKQPSRIVRTASSRGSPGVVARYSLTSASKRSGSVTSFGVVVMPPASWRVLAHGSCGPAVRIR